MHIVTKILIVFCAVLSLLLAALTMTYAANANALRASIKSEQNAAQAAKTEAGTIQMQAGKIQGEQEKTLVSLTGTIASQLKEIAALQSERTDLRSREQRALSDADSIRSQIAQFTATAQTQTALIKNYRDEVTALREASLGATKREIELLDKINDLASSREVLEQNARALKEQLQEIKLAAQQAASGGGATSAATPRELPGPVVRARVMETFKSLAGDDMVVINEGSNRGLKENTQMNVARNDGFIASIVITAVEPTKAVGKVSSARTGPVMKDDVVLSRLD